jgi:polysaccharide biosynthesis/export protein
MAGGPSVAVLRDIQTLFDTGTASGLSDRQLLERFVGRRDASAEAAFEVLVLRHGPMVLRVCHIVLGDATDAQDAFQATFLVLVKRSGSIRRLESLGSWLYGVACRVAARARVEAARRRAAERRGALRVVPVGNSSDCREQDCAEFGTVIQEEVRRLPEKYRAVVTLCYWQGLTQEQAATQLGCPLGTVRSRLARARGQLHKRLTCRGLAPLAGVVAAALESRSAGAARLDLVSNALIHSTVKASAQVIAGRALSDVTSTSVAVLTQSVLRSMFMMKFKMAMVALVLVGLGAYGASMAAPQADSGKSSPGSRHRSYPTAEKPRSKAQPALVTLGSYVVEPPDLLIVEVLEALPGRPISGERLVRPDGKIALGFYGDIYVAGLTIPEVKEKVVRHLQKYLGDETLGLSVRDGATGEPVIDPKTKEPKQIDPKDSDRVFVEVTAYNSTFYYVQGEVIVPGRMQVTGKETILDAINFVGGMSTQADHEGVVLYRQPQSGGPLQAFPIDIDQITLGDDLSTNYQLLPGDRLVVPRMSGLTSGDEETKAEHPQQESPSQPVHSRQFDRRPMHFDAPTRKPATARDKSLDNGSSLRRVEARLNEVERKLDLIIEAMKSRTP